MQDFDDLIQLIFEHIDDNRVTLKKEIKHGYKHYYLSFYANNTLNINNSYLSDNFELRFDNRNSCIEMFYNHGIENIIIENDYLLEKWSEIFNNYLNTNIYEKANDKILKVLNSCEQKDIYRRYQMKKILPDNESI
jgi:hypothetical protein